MQTKEEILQLVKDEVALKHGAADWRLLSYRMDRDELEKIYDNEVSPKFAVAMCDKQKVVCYEIALDCLIRGTFDRVLNAKNVAE